MFCGKMWYNKTELWKEKGADGYNEAAGAGREQYFEPGVLWD